jgi:hypothetical protein
MKVWITSEIILKIYFKIMVSKKSVFITFLNFLEIFLVDINTSLKILIPALINFKLKT